MKRLIGVVWLILAPSLACAGDDLELPLAPPQDAVMASLAEVQQWQAWVDTALLGQPPAAGEPAVAVVCRRQDYNVLRFGQSCMETPLKIGQQSFQRGLGTHANSEILVTFPPGMKTFQAKIGIDNNDDTQGIRGSVQFSIELGGREVFRSTTLRGGDAPTSVQIAIPSDARELVLKVDTTDDGPSHDQADWANARLVTADGRALWLDDQVPSFLSTAPPFSFNYGGMASADLMSKWSRSVNTQDEPHCRRHTVVWTDGASGLEVTAVVKVWKQFPAVDWVLYFKNQGPQNTPVLSQIQALDVSLATGNSKRPVTLHHLVGDVCGERSFLPQEAQLEVGQNIHLAPTGGRSSNGAFPFFNIQYASEGLITAIGWSGQWAASLTRTDAGPSRLQAGMELTNLVLHPGEQIRSPRILLLGWKGDRQAAHNRWRRLMLYHYVPQIDGQPLRLPIASQCFDRYNWTRPEWATEAGQVAAAKVAHDMGCDTHWLDAAWFADGFPNGVGNWFHRPAEFPHGLKPISDACHAQDLKFIVWFEPERVAAGSLIAREHPEFVLGGTAGGLFKLHDPEARRWLTELLSQRITEFGMDMYRNDFNIDPLPFWRQNDPPDRQGITEIRYVEGHYAMWDELRAAHPGLWIDNCASGGRRIDLETCMRSVPLWRSDTSCSPGHPDWNQTQTQGLSLYLPLFTACGWTPAAYDLRSSATAGAICQFDFLNPEFSLAQAQAALAEVQTNRKYWLGDFYPLTSATTGADQWAAYQFHRADLNAGLVLAFRRAQCNYSALEAPLQGLDPEQEYTVEFIDDARQAVCKTMSGRELMAQLELRLPARESSLVVRYQPAAPAAQ